MKYIMRILANAWFQVRSILLSSCRIQIGLGSSTAQYEWLK